MAAPGNLLRKRRDNGSMIRFPVGLSGQVLILSDRVLAHFAANRQLRWFQREAGGQLFARFTESEIIVEEATGPRPTDRRSRFGYRGDRKAEQTEILRLHRGGLHYVGDWHTHPEDHPTPSPADRIAITDSVAKSQHNLRGFVMVIVGRAIGVPGLHVSIADATDLHVLGPVSN